MQLFIFAKNGLEISNIESIAENTGFFHIFPNKVNLRSFYHHKGYFMSYILYENIGRIMYIFHTESSHNFCFCFNSFSST